MPYQNMKKEAEKYGIPYEKQGRVLVWHDEFDGEELNKQKWQITKTMGANDRIYTNDKKHARVENGKMVLQAFRSEDDKDIFTLPDGLNTLRTMNFKYGYLEMYANVPIRQGAWTSFWMLSNTVFKEADWMSEIDIFECFGHPTTIYPDIHKHGGKERGSHHLQTLGGKFIIGDRGYSFNEETINDEYHLYGLEWDEKFLKFSIDGEVYSTFPIEDDKINFCPQGVTDAAAYHDFHYVIMNNELMTEGGWYKHSPESRVKDHTVFPFTYSIDYVRLYQKEGEEIKLVDEIEKAYKEKE